MKLIWHRGMEHCLVWCNSGKNITVEELIDRYLATKIGVKPNTRMNYNFVRNLMKNEAFSRKKISQVRVSDAKLFLIKLQNDGKGYSTTSKRGIAASLTDGCR